MQTYAQAVSTRVINASSAPLDRLESKSSRTTIVISALVIVLLTAPREFAIVLDIFGTEYGPIVGYRDFLTLLTCVFAVRLATHLADAAQLAAVQGGGIRLLFSAERTPLSSFEKDEEGTISGAFAHETLRGRLAFAFYALSRWFDSVASMTILLALSWVTGRTVLAALREMSRTPLLAPELTSLIVLACRVLLALSLIRLAQCLLVSFGRR